MRIVFEEIVVISNHHNQIVIEYDSKQESGITHCCCRGDLL